MLHLTIKKGGLRRGHNLPPIAMDIAKHDWLAWEFDMIVYADGGPGDLIMKDRGNYANGTRVAWSYMVYDGETLKVRRVPTQPEDRERIDEILQRFAEEESGHHSRKERLEQTGVRQLRYMASQNKKGTLCPYCQVRTNLIEPGTQIAGHYGIAWGHVPCVEVALDMEILISSSSNYRDRPDWANKISVSAANFSRLRRHHDVRRELGIPIRKVRVRKPTNQEVANKHSTDGFVPVPGDEKLKVRPPMSCDCFPPKIICLVTMSRHQRPDMTAVINDECGWAHRAGARAAVPDGQLLRTDPFREILERIWRKLLEERFSHYKLQGNLPHCTQHQWHHGLKVVATVAGKWDRALWWVCPVHDKKDSELTWTIAGGE